MKRTLKILMSAALVSATFSVAAMADEDNTDSEQDSGYSDFNADNSNDGISQDEWASGFDQGGMFDSWDTNGDGLLSRDEHRNGYFSCFDQDRNDRISREEYHRTRGNGLHCGLARR